MESNIKNRMATRKEEPIRIVVGEVTPKKPITCPFCGGKNTKVLRTNGSTRVRICAHKCGRRFVSYEICDGI